MNKIEKRRQGKVRRLEQTEIKNKSLRWEERQEEENEMEQTENENDGKM